MAFYIKLKAHTLEDIMKKLIMNKVIGYIILTVLSISILTFLIIQEYNKIIDDQMVADEFFFYEMSNKLDLNIKETITFIYGLRGFVSSQIEDGISSEEFYSFSSEAQSVSNNVKNFSVAPDNIQMFVYPLAGNEVTLGHNLEEDQREYVRLDIAEAMSTGNIVISGPYELRQGNLGMVVRNPIFDGYKYWGVVNVVVDVEKIILESYDNYSFNSGITSVSISNDHGVFWSSGEEIKPNIEYIINVLSDKWYVRGYVPVVLSYDNMLKWIQQSILYSIVVFAIYVFGIRLLSNNHMMSNRISKLIFSDTLTKLPNRRALDKSIELLISQNISFGLVFIDLDDFKNINDSLGHSVGDKVLVEITRRIQNTAIYEAYRWGGDEFILIWKGNDSQLLKSIVSDVVKKIMDPIYLNDEEYRVTSTSGISFYPEDGCTKDEVIMLADATMYIAKKRGKNQILVYDKSIGEHLRSGYQVERKLELALLNGELEVHYQPQLFFSSNKVEAVEALVRWRGENNEYIPPSVFIPIAEQHGLINKLDEYVLEQAAKQINIWKKYDLHIKIAVNISAKHFTTSLVDFMDDLIIRYSINSSDIEIEITETAAISNFAYTKDLIHTLQSMGINVVLDDFGTGFSSLSYLSEMNFNMIKIDKQFIDRLEEEKGRKEYAIIKSIVDLAKALNLKCIAEGVENEKQLELVQSTGCDAYQGYFLAKPMSPESLLKWYNDILDKN